MYVPLWLIPTIVYALVLLACLRSATSETGYFGGFAQFITMGFATIAYLLFWVAYLALTRG